MSVDRRPSVWGSGLNTGLAFRVRDDKNFCFAYTSGDSATSNQLTVRCYNNGSRNVLVSAVPMPSFVWTRLHVRTDTGGGINVYADEQSVATTSTSWLANETGAGLYNDAYGMALTNRWDNFMVLDTQ